jgi:UDP-glucose 4-epimerase
VNVLVVGAAGFLGSHLVDRLVGEGHSVDAIDDLSTGSLGNLADARALGGDLRIHTLNAASDELATLAGRRQPEAIVHLGWMPPGHSTPADAGAAVHSMLAVLDTAANLGSCKVVTTVAAEAFYGEVSPRELPIKEGHSSQPVGVRGVIGRTMVELCEHYRAQRAVEHTVLVMGTVYGPRQRSDGGVVAAFRAAKEREQPARVDGDGRQTRDFVYVDDAVDALTKALVKADGLCVNVGTGVATSVRELWELVAGPQAEWKAAPERPTGVARSALAGTRARIQLGWAAWTELAVGLRSY